MKPQGKAVVIFVITGKLNHVSFDFIFHLIELVGCRAGVHARGAAGGDKAGRGGLPGEPRAAPLHAGARAFLRRFSSPAATMD